MTTSGVSGSSPIPDPGSIPVTLSLVIPAYNEGRRLAAGVSRLRGAIDAGSIEPETTEFIVVDDGSSDDTTEQATALFAQFPHVRHVRLPENRGKGGAVRAGVAVATAPIIAFADADMAIDPAQTPQFIAALSQADLAIGSRAGPEASVDRPSLQRSIMNRVFNRLVNALTRVSLADTQCGFKAFRAPAAKLLFHCSITERFAFDVEVLSLARRLGFSIHEVPVHWLRVEGSQIRPWSDARSMVRDVIRAGRASAQTPPIPTLTVKVPAEPALGSEAATPVDAVRAVLPPGLSLLTQDDERMLVLCPLMAETEIDAVAAQILAYLPGAALERAVITMAQLSALTPRQPHSDQASRSSDGNRTPLRHR
jgi:dolichyl-phosphate beta-glucosyltransferase